jgi:hypothetical protein
MDTVICNYCQTRAGSNNKFQESIKDLVSSTIKTQLPNILTETIKTSVATTIVKQTKDEMSSIHSKNFKSIQESVLSFAQTKLDQVKEQTQTQVKSQWDQAVSDEFKRVLMATVIPH